MNLLSVPPLTFGERFEDAYEVVLILDDREQFAVQGLVNQILFQLGFFSWCSSCIVTSVNAIYFWFLGPDPGELLKIFALSSRSK